MAQMRCFTAEASRGAALTWSALAASQVWARLSRQSRGGGEIRSYILYEYCLMHHGAGRGRDRNVTSIPFDARDGEAAMVLVGR